jgi:hypothetical protein
VAFSGSAAIRVGPRLQQKPHHIRIELSYGNRVRHRAVERTVPIGGNETHVGAGFQKDRGNLRGEINSPHQGGGAVIVPLVHIRPCSQEPAHLRYVFFKDDFDEGRTFGEGPTHTGQQHTDKYIVSFPPHNASLF